MDIAENNVIRFKNISRKKDGIFANYRVKALHNGVTISATLSVDITALDLDPNQDTMEKMIHECAKLGLKELKKAAFEFEGNLETQHLGVAQLG
ncbi:MAG TPA: hypothetical protein VLG44_00330 [Chlamydiales bacterium]|nr:hypothetical protein [Chlamydiales bacterium]